MHSASTQNLSHSTFSAQNPQILTFSSQYIILRIIRKCGLGGVWDKGCWPPWRGSCSRILFSSIQRLLGSSRTLFSSIQRVLGTSLVTLGGHAKSIIFVLSAPPGDRPRDPGIIFSLIQRLHRSSRTLFSSIQRVLRGSRTLFRGLG